MIIYSANLCGILTSYFPKATIMINSSYKTCATLINGLIDSEYNCSSSNSWIYSTSYWLSKVESYAYLYVIAEIPGHDDNILRGVLSSISYENVFFGLCPVITINKSEL